jgi:prepilin-type processing-associated H-X9-DG protein
VAYTAYVGVWGTSSLVRDGCLYVDSKIRLADVSDGLSSTLLVGERPPSADLRLGWWYAGWGQNKDGSAEMVLGVNEIKTATRYRQCPPGPYSFGPGAIADDCDAFHFWSMHKGGAHFAFADGSVRFLRYSADHIMSALATRAGGETVTVPD